MVERGDGAGLLLEAGAAAGIARDIGGENLDGHIAAQTRIAGPVNLSHGAGAQTGDNLVRAEAD